MGCGGLVLACNLLSTLVHTSSLEKAPSPHHYLPEKYSFSLFQREVATFSPKLYLPGIVSPQWIPALI